MKLSALLLFIGFLWFICSSFVQVYKTDSIKGPVLDQKLVKQFIISFKGEK